MEDSGDEAGLKRGLDKMSLTADEEIQSPPKRLCNSDNVLFGHHGYDPAKFKHTREVQTSLILLIFSHSQVTSLL